LNAQEASEMIEACEKNNVKLMEAFMYRFTDRTKKVKEVLDSGVLGDIKYINSSFRFFLNRPNTIKMVPELGGGSLYDVGCYPINFVGMVTGKEPVSMSAECVLQDGVDVLFSAVLKYDNDIVATINSGFNAFEKMYSEIIGSKGLLEIPDTFLDNAGVITLTTEEGKKEIAVEQCERYLLEVEDFADAIINDRKPLFSYEETVRNMKIIDKLLKDTYRKG
jgi:predicted dehydrogenase